MLTRAHDWSLTWARCILPTPCHPTSLRKILISSHICLGLLSGLFPSGFLTKILYTFLISPMYATCPVLSISSSLTKVKALQEKLVKLRYTGMDTHYTCTTTGFLWEYQKWIINQPNIVEIKNRVLRAKMREDTQNGTENGHRY